MPTLRLKAMTTLKQMYHDVYMYIYCAFYWILKLLPDHYAKYAGIMKVFQKKIVMALFIFITFDQGHFWKWQRLVEGMIHYIISPVHARLISQGKSMEFLDAFSHMGGNTNNSIRMSSQKWLLNIIEHVIVNTKIVKTKPLPCQWMMPKNGRS